MEKHNTVYVAMCADPLHVGHIRILKRAKELGRVVVGLLTDEAIISYKGAPTNTWEMRKEVVDYLHDVDEVIPQCTLDYTHNLERIRPRYVVHGSDWKTGPQQATRGHVINILATWGGEVVEPDYTEGVSSTIIKCSLIRRE